MELDRLKREREKKEKYQNEKINEIKSKLIPHIHKFKFISSPFFFPFKRVIKLGICT